MAAGSGSSETPDEAETCTRISPAGAALAAQVVIAPHCPGAHGNPQPLSGPDRSHGCGAPGVVGGDSDRTDTPASLALA